MKKRIVTIALVIALLATCFAGTFAYLKDTDAAVNTMTVGNVKIQQLEHKLVDGALVELGANPVMQMFPVVFFGNGEYPGADVKWYLGNQYANLDTSDGTALLDRWVTLWDEPNVVDKMISVENTGDHDAYVRTIVAVPAEIDDHIVLNCAFGKSWAVAGVEDKLPSVEFNGETYNILIFTYDRDGGILEEGKNTGPSVLQVLLEKDVENDDIPDKFDTGFKIIAVSQAAQTAGFTSADQALNAAFGDPTAENIAKWLATATTTNP